MFTIGISRGSHLLLICTGAPVFDDFLALADLAAALCRREGWSRVLIDCACVPATLTADERVQIATHASSVLTGKRVALVVADDERYENARAALASAGATLHFFTAHLDAANWLASLRT